VTTTALILLVSGILIGTGISVIWRDVQRSRRSAFVFDRDAPVAADPDVEITISPTSAGGRLPDPETPRAPVPPRPESREPPSRTTISDPEELRQAARLQVEQQWAALQSVLAAGVDKVNAVLAPAHLSISTSGEPAWSYKNRGYGAYRRLLMGEDSVAWLRLELGTDGWLRASVKAHRDERAELNASAEAAADGLNAAVAGDLLSQCLKPAAAYAALQQRTASDSVEQASAQAWQGVDAIVTAALKASNGALKQAGARLIPHAPAAWEAELSRHRMTLSVEVNGNNVARMHIERLPQEMEVAVGVRDTQLVELGRRRRLPVQGMTIHALAELIASCAWPIIARSRESRRSA